MIAPSRLLGLRGCRSPGALLFIPPSSRRRQRGANQNPCSAVNKGTLKKINIVETCRL